MTTGPSLDITRNAQEQIVDIARVRRYRAQHLLFELVYLFEKEVPIILKELSAVMISGEMVRAFYLLHCLTSKVKTLGALKMEKDLLQIQDHLQCSEREEALKVLAKLSEVYSKTVQIFYIEIASNDVGDSIN